MKVAFSHIGLNCKDMAVTEAFYTKTFGFKRARVFEIGENPGDAQIIFLKLGEVYLELFAADSNGPAHENDGPSQAGVIRHLAFQVDDVDAVLAKLDDPDITLGPATFDDFIEGWKTVWIRDPDGNIVEISQGYKDDPALVES
ncbi:MAG: VOC family protein [Deinococcota bacterium]